MPITRRHFLRDATAAMAGFAGLATFVGGCSRSGGSRSAAGYGRLIPDPAGVLDLPAGFRYTMFSSAGETMDDGLVVPARHDGMAAFADTDGTTLLVRNHENTIVDPGPFGAGDALLARVDSASIYDRGFGKTPSRGGTTTIRFDTRTQRLVSHWLSLAGTERNCAGGPTPWGTWLTCEESVVRADGTHERDHGFVFEVPITPGLADPVALAAMGRFNHEAVAVEPSRGIVYLTEDRGDGLLYRFLPTRRGRLADGGRLQALAVLGRPSLDTSNRSGPTLAPGQPVATQWLDVRDVTAPNDDLRLQGFAAGAARFSRGEGMWFGRDAVYFACTDGGAAGRGQLFRYRPSPDEGTPAEANDPGRLELFLESAQTSILENADNLTIAPWGDVIVCEDSLGADGMVGITPTGEAYRLAEARGHLSELAGACFAPDGSTLFVNVQERGLTLAITGPWRTE